MHIRVHTRAYSHISRAYTRKSSFRSFPKLFPSSVQRFSTSLIISILKLLRWVPDVCLFVTKKDLKKDRLRLNESITISKLYSELRSIRIHVRAYKF